ncbi:hypothetical protein BA919_08515 [Helicobacter pullorum]|uniref:hypothetical protein n=1 Tax=Helicobacter pullorum TaxID=35818 RepID=UPI000816A218|nr:hypothetical protein [Helicobacter pullorum]OCR12716.1 hypothetical protein BA919_08515 [Helicobacter pullorum]
MVEIEKFLQRCRMGQSAFKILPYDKESDDTEIGRICSYMKKCDYKSIIDFWKIKDKNKYLELQHPLYENIITRAVFSMAGCIFFIDKNNKHPWVLFQAKNIIDRILVEDRMYTFPFCSVVMINFNIFNNLDIRNLMYRDVEFYFCLGGAVFWHFFYEELIWIYQISPRRLFCLETSYFIPLYYQKKIIKNNEVLVFPRVIGGGRLAMERTSSECVEIGKKIYNDAICNYVEDIDEDNSKYDLIIWLGLVYRKDGLKTWLNQKDAILHLFDELLDNTNINNEKIKIYLDGLKAYENSNFLGAGDEKLILEILEAISAYGCKIVSLHGKTMKQAISCCSDCHIAIVEAGSGAIIPVICCNKPTILYGNVTYIEHISKLNDGSTNVIKIDKNFISEVEFPRGLKRWTGEKNYFIPYQHIYNLAAEVLEKLSGENKLKVKNLKMHRLEVPPVKLIAKQYELEKQFEVKIPLENVEFVDKLATQLQQKDQIIQTKTQELTSKNQELESKTQELTQTKNQLDSTKQQLDSKTKELSSLPIKKQTLEIKNLEQDLINKQLHTKKLEKELGYESNVLKELEIKNQQLTQTKNQLESKTKELESANKILFSNPNTSHLIQNTSCFKGKLAYLNTLTTAKDRIHNHLSYKLGQAMIENSKSLLGYIRMPYVLSYIKDKHKQEQQQYQEAIKKNPNLKLPNLESYPDYQESLKEKECLTYKLGEAFMKADKTWYKGGYVKLWFEVRRLKGERN